MIQSKAASPRGASVSVRGLTKVFGRKRVLRGLDLHIPAGQFVAIVGRSGCGKSTLLRLIAGLDAADDGSITLGGGSRGGIATRVMFQEPRLLPWASVLSNVEVGLSDAQASAEGRLRALGALNSVGLADRERDWPTTLSGGQKQRVALARALVSGPRVLALDEPLGALDALTRIEMQGLLADAWLREGFTAILVTHDVAEAVALADRIVLIENGAIALDLPVSLPRPRHRGGQESGALEARILDRLLGRQVAVAD
jgi:sulfonate transport system ATP-binding protein